MHFFNACIVFIFIKGYLIISYKFITIIEKLIIDFLIGI